MGEPVLAWFAVATLAGIVLVVAGAVLRRRVLVAAGTGLLVALAGAWVLGPPAVLVGAVAGGLVWAVGRSASR